MSVKKKKGNDASLKILAPGEESPQRTFWETLGLTWAILGVLCIVSLELVWWRDDPDAPHSQTARAKAPPTPPLLKLASRLSELSPEELAERLPTLDEPSRLAILTHGPRTSAEQVCEQELSPDTPPPAPALVEALAESLDRVREHAPRICMVRHLFDGAGEGVPALRASAGRYWAHVEAEQEDPVQVVVLLNTLRMANQLPIGALPFRRWLRRCVLRPDRVEGLACVRAARAVSPALGRDLVELVDDHLADHEPGKPPSAEALGEAAEVLGELGRHGSPEAWRIENHPNMLRYDYDLRIGAIFMMCRMVNAPDTQVASDAARALSSTARMASTITPLQLERWRTACLIAFGGNRPDLEVVSLPDIKENHVPALSVWSGQEGQPPRYELADVIARGDCPAPGAEQPRWICGSVLWKGTQTDISAALDEAFTDTRYLEWMDRAPR